MSRSEFEKKVKLEAFDKLLPLLHRDESKRCWILFEDEKSMCPELDCLV